jgi:DNA modification methylase
MQIRDRIKGLRRVRAGDLRPHPKNWRKHPEAQQNALRGVLAEVGYVDAILVRELPGGALQIIDGHLRAETTPDAEVPVLVVDLTDAETDLVLATFDSLTAMAEADPAVLDQLLKEVQTTSEAVAQMLLDLAKDSGCEFGQDEEVTEDDVPEPPEVPITQLGDLWKLGEHLLLCGDSTKPEDVARLLQGRKPVLMVTDPPYGVEYDPEWRHQTGLNNSDRTGKVTNDDRVDWTEAYNLFPGDVCYVWHAGRFAAELATGLTASRFEVRAQIIWRKPRFAISRGHYHWQHEPCWYAVRKGRSAHWTGDRSQSTVWDIAAKDGTGETRHGTQKPVECMARPIRNHGGVGVEVYDPFLGSGSTIIAAEQLHRRCYGLEIDPAYCDVIVHRFERFTGKKAERIPQEARS